MNKSNVSKTLVIINQFAVSGSNAFIFIIIGYYFSESEIVGYANMFAIYLLMSMIINTYVSDIYLNKISFHPQKARGSAVVLLLVLFPVIILIANLVQLGDIYTHSMVYIYVLTLIDLERRIYNLKLEVILITVLIFLVAISRVFLTVISSSLTEALLLQNIIISLLLFIFYMVKKNEIEFSSTLIDARKNIYNMISMPLQWLWGHSPLFLLQTYFPTSIVALYVLVRSVVNAFNVILELIPVLLSQKLKELFYSHKSMAMAITAYSVLIGIGLILYYYSIDFISSTSLMQNYSFNHDLFFTLMLLTFIVSLLRIISIYIKLLNLTVLLPISFLIGLSWFLKLLFFEPVDYLDVFNYALYSAFTMYALLIFSVVFYRISHV